MFEEPDKTSWVFKEELDWPNWIPEELAMPCWVPVELGGLVQEELDKVGWARKSFRRHSEKSQGRTKVASHIH